MLGARFNGPRFGGLEPREPVILGPFGARFNGRFGTDFGRGSTPDLGPVGDLGRPICGSTVSPDVNRPLNHSVFETPLLQNQSFEFPSCGLVF